MKNLSNAEIARKCAGADNYPAAQVYALLAIADAIEASRVPAEVDIPEVPFEQTREGWQW